MIIRKKFKFEGAHIVRNCSSVRCRENIHGHSYVVEVFIKSNTLDDGFMVMDFILLDKISQFIDSFDHSYSLWDKERDSVKKAVYEINARVVEFPVSPTAEGYALMFFYVLDQIILNTAFANNEGEVKLHAVRVHETQTGYAEASREDLAMVNFELNDILFSEGVSQEWKDQNWWNDLKGKRPFNNQLL